MKYIIIASILLSVFSLKEIPHFCKNCKFFRNDFLLGNKYGKCSLFQELDDPDFLVTGKGEYLFCSIVRDNDDKCGKEGKMYEEKKTFFIFKNDDFSS